MTERNPLPCAKTPPGWPPPERMDAIMEAIRRGIERYREEFAKRDAEKARQSFT